MIPKEKLQVIETTAGDVVKVINEGTKWVNDFLKAEEKYIDNYELKKCRRQINKVKAVVAAKPVIALFGASQVGKSYMANNLLYNKENTLMIYNHKAVGGSDKVYEKQLIDYLVNINPDGGGKEATATITRFTSDKINGVDRLPVKVMLFDVKDVICILCDTYNSEYKDTVPLPNKKEILSHIEEIKSCISNSEQSFLNDDDVYEIKEYLDRYFIIKNAFLEELNTVGFWDFLADNIKLIPKNYWTKIFEILWNKHQEISNVFDVTISALSKMNFDKEVYVSFEAIVRDNADQSSNLDKEGSIINVKTLYNFFNDNISYQVQLQNGQFAKVDSSKLCLLAAEVSLSVDDGTIENRPFIKNVDILDFPGARSRDKLEELSEENISKMMLVRGKVSYLFNRYSLDYKTNTLAVCMRTVATNVTSMPDLVNQWIDNNLGSDVLERTANLTALPTPPLFVIFTWWNTQFAAERAAEKPQVRINAQFNTLLTQEITSDKKWPREWIVKNGSVNKFNNYYLLRDFERSKDTFNQTELIEFKEGLYNEKGKLTLYDEGVNGVSPFFKDETQKQYHKAYFEKFIEFHKSEKGLFENPEVNFLESSIPGKDGSELIIQQLIPISNNNVTVPIYINALNKALDKAKEKLSRHHHSDKADEQILKAAKDGSSLQLKMDIIFGVDGYYFGSFIEHLTVQENEILTFYHDLLQSEKLIRKKDITSYTILRMQNPGISRDNTYNENLEVLRKNYNKDTIEETETHVKEKEGIDLNELFYGNKYDLQNNSLILAQEAKNYWIEKKLNVENFNFFVQLGFERNQLVGLFDTLRITFEKDERMTRMIAEQIRRNVDTQKKVESAEGMIADITAASINQFVTSVGWTFYSDAEKEKIRDTNTEYKLKLKIPDDNEVFQPIDKEALAKKVEYMDKLYENLSKNPIDTEAVKHVPMVRNYQRWVGLMKVAFIANCDKPTYNVEANRSLKQIIDKINEYQFSVS